MKHLFIINPNAARVKGNVANIVESIDSFFCDMKMENYQIHVTRYVRDGMGIANRFARTTNEPLRIHAIGGSGTLYEVVNGTIGLPNVQLATYPYGKKNYCVRNFDKNREYKFMSLRNQVFSNTLPVDTIRCGGTYGVCGAATKPVFKNGRVRERYNVSIDNRDYSGHYFAVNIATMPDKRLHMPPCVCGGLMNITLVGESEKIVRGKSVVISTGKDISINIDGEIFYEREFVCKIAPAAIDVVCPVGGDAK